MLYSEWDKTVTFGFAKRGSIEKKLLQSQQYLLNLNCSNILIIMLCHF